MEKVSPYFVPMSIANMAAAQVAIRFGLKGMCTCPVTACAGGTNAVGDAFHYIRDGYAEVMLCGGTEASITPMSIGGFTSMKALTQTEDPDRASIPFDAERSGFVMGEGAGVLLLEELSHAQARGAKIYAEIVGYGATCDAHHITAPLADGSDFTAAYCEIPYTEVALSEDGMTLTVTMHDTFLSSGTLSKDVDPDFLKEYGSLYPESFPAGELAGSCTLIENADLRQDGNIAVLTVTLADGPIHGRNFGDGYYRFTAETGYTGIADIGPYLRVTLNATNELFAGN